MNLRAAILLLGTAGLVTACDQSPEAQAEDAVAAKFQFPKTVEFKYVTRNETPQYGLVICGGVHAQNKYGGDTGYSQFLVEMRSGTVRLQKDEVDTDFSNHWVDECIPR